MSKCFFINLGHGLDVVDESTLNPTGYKETDTDAVLKGFFASADTEDGPRAILFLNYDELKNFFIDVADMSSDTVVSFVPATATFNDTKYLVLSAGYTGS